MAIRGDKEAKQLPVTTNDLTMAMERLQAGTMVKGHVTSDHAVIGCSETIQQHSRTCFFLNYLTMSRNSKQLNNSESHRRL